MERLQRLLDRLSPEQKQHGVLLLAGVGVLALILGLSATVPTPTASVSPKPRVDRHLLTEADPRALGVDGLAAEIRALRKDQSALLERMARLENPPEKPGAMPSLAEKEALSTLETLRSELEALKIKTHEAPEDSIYPEPNKREPPTTPAAGLFQGFPKDLQGFEPRTPSATAIRVIRANDRETPRAASDQADKAYPLIPAGTLIAGVLLNGLDAPTGTQARKEPYPVLVRVKDQAILPNRFRADVRECFLVGAGYGDLSAERAYIRAEVFSCLRHDGQVTEVPLDAYAVGEDGKLGLRGRLVDKQGQRMAESLLAGFANSFSSLFGRVQIPVVMAGGQSALPSSVPYQNVFSQEAAEGAVYRGTGAALDRLSNYYMDLAEHLFPVIEIDATRHIEFVVQRGFRLDPRARSERPPGSGPAPSQTPLDH